jgi:hypothetical protein
MPAPRPTVVTGPALKLISTEPPRSPETRTQLGPPTETSVTIDHERSQRGAAMTASSKSSIAPSLVETTFSALRTNESEAVKVAENRPRNAGAPAPRS